MREIRYQLLFEGRVTPDDEMGVSMSLEARARFTGTAEAVFAEGAPQAVYKAQVENAPDGSFSINGTLLFGGGTLTVEGEESRLLIEVPGEPVHLATFSLRITAGSGAFAGAKGRIASVFTVGEDGSFRDSQSGVVFLVS